MTRAEAEPASPCIRVCRLDEQGLCVGCLRTLDEIEHWPEMDRDARRCLLEELERRRERAAT